MPDPHVVQDFLSPCVCRTTSYPPVIYVTSSVTPPEGASDMALLVAQQITKAGLTPAYSAVSASDTITPDSVGMFLHVKNAGGSADTVTLDDAGTTPGGSSPTDPTVSVVATTGDKMIYIPPSFVNTATGVIVVTHSFTTSVTCGLFRVV